MIMIPANSHLLFFRIGDPFESYWMKPNEDPTGAHRVESVCVSHDNSMIAITSRNPSNNALFFSTHSIMQKSSPDCIKIDIANPPSERCIHCTNPAAPKLDADYSCGTTCNPERVFDLDIERCAWCTSPECRFCDSTTCFDCFVPKWLSSNQCVDPCPNFFYPDVGPPRKCLPCQSPCENCLSPTHCMSCLNPIEYVEQDAGTCDTVCPIKYRINSPSKIC